MNCDRAFVSLIDSSTQYILAEATRSISIRDSSNFVDPHDALFLGVQSLGRGYGICPESVAIFTDCTGHHAVNTHGVVADTTRYVIRDLRELDQYKHCPYVVGFPHMVSYAEVPIKSASGHILGTYCVVDTKIRDDFFHNQTINILNDIAVCITEHLELHAVKLDSGRGLQMMKGLSEFIESRLSRSISASIAPRPGSSTSHESSAEYLNRHLLPPEATSLGSSCASDRQDLDNASLHCGTAARLPLAISSDWRPASSSAQQVHVAGLRNQTLKGIHTGVAHIIRAAIDLEGLVFLNAPDPSSSLETGQSSSKHQPISNGVGVRGSSSACDVLGYSIVAEASKLGSAQHPLTLSDNSLNYLIREFPRGCVFVADAQDSPFAGREEVFIAQTYIHETLSVDVELPSELQTLIREARSLIFLPLWDSTQERFIVSVLGWSSDPTRVLAEQDMTCLSAFGSTFMTEVARTEMAGLARAKSDFLSSVSHELRSPLHGIYAAVDLLLDLKTETTLELIEIIQTCSSTLLDTLNHVLDFSNVNKLTDVEQETQKLSCSAEQDSSQKAPGDTAVEYLSVLVQDVVVGVHFGQASRRTTHEKIKTTSVEEFSGPNMSLDSALLIDSVNKAAQSAQVADDVAVFVNVERRPEWRMMLCVGAWKRLVMNLFANALKYTHYGFIEVSLKMVTLPENSEKRTVHLMVSDTGIGMSPEFLKHSLYEPFVQEDPVADGTGLGLSIVKKIVEDLQGTINVRSTQGVGTRFDVLVPIVGDHESLKDQLPSEDQVLDSSEMVKGLSVCLFTPSARMQDHHVSAAQLDVQVRRAATLQSCLRSIARDWLGMEFSCSDTLDNLDADFIVAEKSRVVELIVANPALVDQISKHRMILVGPSTFSDLDENGLVDFVNLVYPISPKALARALRASLNSTMNTRSSLLKEAIPLPPLLATQHRRNTTLGHANLGPSANNCPTVDHLVAQVERAVVSTPNQRHLLVVDDNPINLHLLSNFLQRLGYTVETAVNGLEALEKYKTTPVFTTIFMDISMPIMNGFECSRAIRSFEASRGVLKPTRIIALTGLGSEASKQEAKMSGIDAFFTKPVKFNMLKELLQ